MKLTSFFTPLLRPVRMEWAGRQLGVGNAAVLMGLSIPKPSRDHPEGLPVGFRASPKRAGGAFPSVWPLSLPILPFLFVFPALYINKEKIIHIILRRKDLPMDGGFRPIVPSCLSFVPQPSISSSRSPFFLSNASFSYPVNLLFLPCIPVFLLFHPLFSSDRPSSQANRNLPLFLRFPSFFPWMPYICLAFVK